MKLRLPRWDSLFTRLLLTQALLVLGLALVVGLLFYMERNVTVARLYAERWAPALAQAAGLAASEAPPAAVLRRAQPPADAYHPGLNAPRFAALRRELAARGVPVEDLRVSLGPPQTLVWLQVTPPGGSPQWLGVAGRLVVPEWSRRALLALALTLALLVAVSWFFTRRLTRPLEQLRERMQAHRPGWPIGEGAAALPAAGEASAEIVAIERAWGELLARQQQHEHERSVLLAGVSHDLRSPLGRIRLAAELLPDEPGVRSRRDAIVRNVAQADRLIESFLDYVRSGTLAFDETVDLAAAARSAIAGFERAPDELVLEAPPTLPWPRANRLLVERVLANLVDNALKHGALPVRVRVGGGGGGGGQAWIEVSDAGAGMSPAQAQHMQQAFARGDPSRSTPGSGLGLAVVRQVVQRLGGELGFEQRQQGFCARVTLRH
jgi:two-component system osmolarity sensor histidine kinase EnvZ